ncbi:monooxygenase, putative [Trichophyton verrucosum HKI 0517]|uniref:Monooxygenase, putative n=1 Tax=Trichophyton verrucosum (strain HKI 0517) TaxID=663202 RepID=D4DFZ3_TRIVH|nr:monooxygenase, putative [Trichophyton verrucosum HKI 0517]EFE39183.1 monooxygenase, putative [Trichophyton verrucosum HKI 0517]
MVPMGPPRNILVLGGGIAGIAAALALSRELSQKVPDLKITIFELHNVPSTSGGAINLNPAAQRHLDHLGVLEELDKMGADGGVEVKAVELFSIHSGRRLGRVDFAGKDGKGYGGYKARRVMRISLHLAMLAAAEKTCNIEVKFGKKVIDGIESGETVTIFFEDGSSAVGDLALGCDGVHSPTRMRLVDPSTLSEYTGVCFIQTTIKADRITAPIHFETTAMNRARQGGLLTTYSHSTKEDIFVAALAEVDAAEISGDSGPRSRNPNRQHRRTTSERLRDEICGRFGDCAIPCVREIIEKSTNWALYPVYHLPPDRKWHTERTLLLGDAAHAMPPRDESAAYALDDAILFSRILSLYYHQPVKDSFDIYESMRRSSVTKAYNASNATWMGSKSNSGRWASRIEACLTPWQMYRDKKARIGAWEFDASTIPIPPPP